MKDFEARIAELTRDNELLAEANRRKDEFLATLGHELRNPLAGVAASVEFLLMPGLDAEDTQRMSGVLRRQLGQLTRLVDDLLDVARILRGKIQLTKQTADLAELVAQAIETNRPVLTAQGRQLHVDLLKQAVPIEADPARLAQVFANLLNNAAKFTRNSGNIWVEMGLAPADGEEPPTALVRIRDDGVGMASEVVPRIFDLFAQGNAAPGRAEGLGIGLTLVRRLVRLHGGSVSAQSDGPGKGSEFVVRLPLSVNDVQHSSPAPAATAVNLPTRRILLIDDNVDATEALAKLLKHLGNDVKIAHDGALALDIAQTFQPEIILLDIGMPGLSGYEVARRLRQQPGLAKAKLVALTGYANEEDRARCLEASFNCHVMKPVTLKTIETLLANGEPPA